MVTVVVRYFAAARAAAGVLEEKLTVPVPAFVGDVLRVAVIGHGARLGQVLDRCSYLLDEVAVHPSALQTTPVGEAQSLDVLPPFAGG